MQTVSCDGATFCMPPHSVVSLSFTRPLAVCAECCQQTCFQQMRLRISNLPRNPLREVLQKQSQQPGRIHTATTRASIPAWFVSHMFKCFKQLTSLISATNLLHGAMSAAACQKQHGGSRPHLLPVTCHLHRSFIFK